MGSLIRAYFTENTPQPAHDFRTEPGKVLDSGGCLTSYYTGRDSRATWRPDMPADVAKALGIDARTMPKDADLDRLRERMHAEAVRHSIPTLIASLDHAIAATETTLTGPVSGRESHLRRVRVDAELARRNIERAAPRSSPSPGM
jgi:hypothetical protein